MKAKEIRQRPKEELQRLLNEKKERLRVLGFNLASVKLKNIKEIRGIKRDIARILTVLRQGSGRQAE